MGGLADEAEGEGGGVRDCGEVGDEVGEGAEVFTGEVGAGGEEGVGV